MCSLPPENFIQFYYCVYSNASFQLAFIVGLLIFYSLHKIGCILHRYMNKLDENNKKINMNVIEFGCYFISTFHAIMVSTSSTVILYSYNFESSINSTAHAYVQWYKILSVLSIAYFFVDICYLVFYFQHKTLKYRLLFIVHHTFGILCMSTVFSTNGYVSYITSLNLMIEWSNVFLNIRIFAKIFSSPLVFYVSGIGVLITYPLTRMVLLAYTMHLAMQPELEKFMFPGAKILVLTACTFVYIMSTVYFLFVMMKKPSKMYQLNNHKIK